MKKIIKTYCHPCTLFDKDTKNKLKDNVQYLHLRKFSTSANNLRVLVTVVYHKQQVFLKCLRIKVTNFQVISEITKNNFSVTPVGVYSRPRAQLLLSHICISVLASLSNIDCFAILWLYLIVLLIWTTLFYTCISFSVISTVHECFQSSFCPLLLLCKYCILSLNQQWAVFFPRPMFANEGYSCKMDGWRSYSIPG